MSELPSFQNRNGWLGLYRPPGQDNFSTPYGSVGVRTAPTAPSFGGAPSMSFGGLPAEPWLGTGGAARTATASNPAANPGPPIGSQSTISQSTISMPASAGMPAQGVNMGSPIVTQQPNPAVAPPQNAMQRWMGSGSSLRPLSPQTRYFWATGRIDARAPQADPSQNAGAVQPADWSNGSQPNSQVGTGNPVQFSDNVAGHSTWQPY